MKEHEISNLDSLFWGGGGGGGKSLIYTFCACAKIPRNPGNLDDSDVHCPCNEHKLSVILQFISTICLLSTLAGIFLHENSSRHATTSISARLQSQLKTKLREIRTRI